MIYEQIPMELDIDGTTSDIITIVAKRLNSTDVDTTVACN